MAVAVYIPTYVPLAISAQFYFREIECVFVENRSEANKNKRILRVKDYRATKRRHLWQFHSFRSNPHAMCVFSVIQSETIAP